MVLVFMLFQIILLEPFTYLTIIQKSVIKSDFLYLKWNAFLFILFYFHQLLKEPHNNLLISEDFVGNRIVKCLFIDKYFSLCIRISQWTRFKLNISKKPKILSNFFQKEYCTVSVEPISKEDRNLFLYSIQRKVHIINIEY